MFRLTKKALLVGAVSLTLLATACGNTSKEAAPTAVDFPAGSTMASIATAGKIKIGATPNQPGLSELDLKGNWKGFNIELAEYLVAPMGIAPDSIEWVHTTMANRIPFIQQGKVEMFATALAITPERIKSIAIAGPYMDAKPQLIVRKGEASKMQSLADIPKGSKICVIQGSQGQPRVSKEIPQATVVEFNALTNCVRALEQGTVDAVDSTAPLLAGFILEKPDVFEFTPMTYGEGEIWGVGVPTEQQDFCTFLNERITAAFEDGTVKKLWDANMAKSGLAEPTAAKELTSCK
ncbi:hypothetical protein CVS30_07470 [Arthrobacter psychrolactophilus]|uniref:Solute-binding protein family 3/N-terminal domain-containing protein n=1 Tax=Arthrobacter psychrolactophilus TaxID=92442 RepID=A0A2V5IRH6_9MICC|nr:transporter substrate-binding domain-containing protein [Arthrobacter psychrolactophilus]PYI39135.1 hypothetical protein CVS30_07470 [Arthrobacter psychrolactophilus]